MIAVMGKSMDYKKIRLENTTIGIVASRFNDHIVDKLLNACMETLVQAGIKKEDIIVCRVPGAFEIPVAVQRLIKSSQPDAVISLGAVIRGYTPHFDYICNECASGLTRVSLDCDTPVIFGVLTVDNEIQAMERAGEGENNKGTAAALAAMEMIDSLRKIES